MRFRTHTIGAVLRGTALAATIAALAVGTANAGTVSYGFGSATGNLGTSSTYSAGGLAIIATGYDAGGAQTDLFGKSNGGDEVGLGLANDPTNDNEIHFGSGFVQLNVKALQHRADPSSVYVTMNSTTNGEQWAVYGSNTAGSYGGTPLTGSDETSHLLPSFGSWRYYDFVMANDPAGQGDNFLISSLSANVGVPEPATWAMMLAGFFGLGAAARRRRGFAAA